MLILKKRGRKNALLENVSSILLVINLWDNPLIDLSVMWTFHCMFFITIYFKIWVSFSYMFTWQSREGFNQSVQLQDFCVSCMTNDKKDRMMFVYCMIHVNYSWIMNAVKQYWDWFTEWVKYMHYFVFPNVYEDFFWVNIIIFVLRIFIITFNISESGEAFYTVYLSWFCWGLGIVCEFVVYPYGLRQWSKSDIIQLLIPWCIHPSSSYLTTTLLDIYLIHQSLHPNPTKR